jgi:hypothetical protein
MHRHDSVSSSGKPGAKPTRHTFTLEAEVLAYWVAGAGSMFGSHHRSGIVTSASREGQTGLLPRLDFGKKKSKFLKERNIPNINTKN